MNINLSRDEDHIFPSSAKIRSFFSITGGFETLFENEIEADELKEKLQDCVTINTDDGEISKVTVVEEEEIGNGLVRVKLFWYGAFSLTHPQDWGIDQIIEQGKEQISITGTASLNNIDYSYSRPVYDIPENWVEQSRNNDHVVKWYLHDYLLIVLALIRVKDKYVIAQFKPPVPSPYNTAQYWEYESKEVAEEEMIEYMIGVQGAFEQGKDDPIGTARDYCSFSGLEGTFEEDVSLAVDFETVSTRQIESVPAFPISDEEVKEVVKGYEQTVDGDCVLLLPEDPVLVPEKSYEVMEDIGGSVAFTVTNSEKIGVFRLEPDEEQGFSWVLNEGTVE